jgi:hypothetical protein
MILSWNVKHQEGGLMPKLNLRACRFCEENEKIIPMECGVCWVECESCKSRGPVKTFKSDAIEAWNNEAKDNRKNIISERES